MYCVCCAGCLALTENLPKTIPVNKCVGRVFVNLAGLALTENLPKTIPGNKCVGRVFVSSCCSCVFDNF